MEYFHVCIKGTAFWQWKPHECSLQRNRSQSSSECTFLRLIMNNKTVCNQKSSKLPDNEHMQCYIPRWFWLAMKATGNCRSKIPHGLSTMASLHMPQHAPWNLRLPWGPVPLSFPCSRHIAHVLQRSVLAGLQIQQQPPHWQKQTLSEIRAVSTLNTLLRKETISILTSQRKDWQHSSLREKTVSARNPQIRDYQHSPEGKQCPLREALCQKSPTENGNYIEIYYSDWKNCQH